MNATGALRTPRLTASVGQSKTTGLLGVILVTPHPSETPESKTLASQVLKHSMGRGQVALAALGADPRRGFVSAASAKHAGGLRACSVVATRVSGCTAKASGAQDVRFSPVGQTVSEVDDAASACTNNDGVGGVTKRSVQSGSSASRRRRLGGGEEVLSRGGSVTWGGDAARAAWWRIDGAAQPRRAAAGCAVGEQVKATGAFGAAAADGWRWAVEDDGAFGGNFGDAQAI